MKLRKREFVSFDEPCQFGCKHCYTYGIPRNAIRSSNEIVSSIQGKQFDVIYVSQKTDNFYYPLKGISLCNQLFSTYDTNLFIITRNVFTADELEQLVLLKNRMNESGKRLFIAISINALESYHVCENVDKVPTPSARINFIIQLAEKNFLPILMLRPVFPNEVIPVTECTQIIEQVSRYVSCVVSSELGVNEEVLDRLGMKESDFKYTENQEYLQGAISCHVKFVDVPEELIIIERKCNAVSVPFFSHSMPALNYVLNKA